ncbi:MAG: (d)CMP kinase [Selenomonadaceae bacterium]|nr:(d)CMP kinase [Selenomonadaceae bacterium]
MSAVNTKIVVAIDGPAGAGKSTVAKILAEKLHCTYIDTGAMYRAVAFEILEKSKNPTEDEIEIQAQKILEDFQIDLKFENGMTRVFVNGRDISEEIRTPRVSQLVPYVASIDFVREKLVDLQRKMSRNQSVVLDGRDIGTVVLPDANVKIFLTASIEERARRRFEELKSKGIESVDLETLQREIAARDRADIERKISPLRQAPDAIRIDSTNDRIDQVVAMILEQCELIR